MFLFAVSCPAVHEGVPLAGQVSKLKALTTAREVSGAMQYLHSQNVLHGDLNGNNILLAGAHAAPGAADQRGFTAKVADFGLSRLLSPGGWQAR
jgi:serine/threonine protein kinase